MPRQFYHTTAEATVRVVEAVYAATNTPDIGFIETFCDFSNAQAVQAIGLAEDLGFISDSAGTYSVANPLAQFLSTPHDKQKASILRIALESYDVFLHFRERLFATNSSDTAARETKAILDLIPHREEIKDTMISLSTYSGAIVLRGGGQYERDEVGISDRLEEVASGCADTAYAENWIRERLGPAAQSVSREDVLLPLASAIVKATANESDDAVQDAASAFESYLAELAARMSVNFGNATGINSKLNAFRTNNDLPKKIVEASKYIGQVRNAAGHGIDTEIGSNWAIQESTGVELVLVVCSMIRACNAYEKNGDYIL